MLLTGLRGVGKTVLLNEIERLAKKEGYHTISIEAHEGKPLGPLIAPQLRSLLFELDRVAGAGDKVKRGLRVLRSFLGVLKVTYEDITVSQRDIPISSRNGDTSLGISQPKVQFRLR